MRQVPYRLLAVLAVAFTLGGCVTYPATPVVVEKTYVRKAHPVYAYSVITDPGYRFYDDTLGVYVFYDRSDVFYRQGRYYRWHRDHWISANHWRGPWIPAPNLTISVNFNDRWHTRLRRHGHHYAGGRHHRPPRRHGYDDSYKRRDRHESYPYRHDRRDKAKDRREERQDRREAHQNRGRGAKHGFTGVAEPKRRAVQVDNRGGNRRNENVEARRKPQHKFGRDERAVKPAGRPAGIRDPRIVPAVERKATDRRTVRDRPKAQTQRSQPRRERKAANDPRKTAAKPAPRQEREQTKIKHPKLKEKNREKNKEKRKKPKKKIDKRDQVLLVREPHTRRSNEPRRRID